MSMVPPWLEAPPAPEYPFDESHDLRSGPELHPAVRQLVPFIGVWRGRGGGEYPTIDSFAYAQEVRFSHDGRPFVFYESRSWLLEDDGTPIRPAQREVGWWRPMHEDGRPTGELEVLLTAPNGIMELYVGRVDGVKVELVTDAVVRTVTAKEVNSGQRLYGIVDGALLYAFEMAAVGQPLTPHLSAKLNRVGG
jgi:THAP4-like, heme-binding beta-barrel domain